MKGRSVSGICAAPLFRSPASTKLVPDRKGLPQLNLIPRFIEVIQKQTSSKALFGTKCWPVSSRQYFIWTDISINRINSLALCHQTILWASVHQKGLFKNKDLNYWKKAHPLSPWQRKSMLLSWLMPQLSQSQLRRCIEHCSIMVK